MPPRTIHPARSLQGALRPPGDKSISHRAAMLAALGAGSSTLANYSTGADCQSTLACMQALGVAVSRGENGIEIAGAGMGGLRAPAQALDAGNSGSTIRLLSGILAAQPFAAEIGGDASLNQRPMARVIAPLAAMGASIAAGAGGLPPLRFSPAASGLHGIEYRLPVASAQVKSAILLAGLYAEGATRVLEPVPTRDHTELMLEHLGVPIERRPGQITLQPAAELKPLGEFRVPGDPSSAAFFLCAAAALPGSHLAVEEVLLNPKRSVLLDVLARLGAQAQVLAVEERAGELVGTLQLQAPAALAGAAVAGAEAAAVIDEVPILAVLATQTRD
ncbi:MAG: 3-phosphoshikimate 1-carboxyvinyltransferase, partial [Terriglobales bacterium]